MKAAGSCRGGGQEAAGKTGDRSLRKPAPRAPLNDLFGQAFAAATDAGGGPIRLARRLPQGGNCQGFYRRSPFSQSREGRHPASFRSKIRVNRYESGTNLRKTDRKSTRLNSSH